jgi:hypothetical protein
VKNKKKKNDEKFYEKFFPKKIKKIPIFKAQSVQHTHPGKFVNKFATHIKKDQIVEQNNEDFFDNLKDFVDGIDLNIGSEKKIQTDVFLTNKNNEIPEIKEEKTYDASEIQPVLHSNFIQGPEDSKYQQHMNSYIQSLYLKYINKERRLGGSVDKKSITQVPYDIIHRTKLKNLKLQNQKIFKRSHLYNKDTKISRFAKSLNEELGRVSNNFGKLDSLKILGDNPKTQFFFENTNEYVAYKMLKMREEDKKQRILPLVVPKDPSIDKLSQGFYKLNKNIKQAFGKKFNKHNDDIVQPMS